MLLLVQIRTQESLDLPTLTAYITYARQHIQPKLSDEAAEDLISGYVAMRRKGNFPGSSKKVSLVMSNNTLVRFLIGVGQMFF